MNLGDLPCNDDLYATCEKVSHTASLKVSKIIKMINKKLSVSMVQTMQGFWLIKEHSVK